MRELPLACSLDASALAARLAEMRAIGRSALVETAPEDGVLSFRATPEVRGRLERVVAAEARCCPFLGLDLSDHGATVRLTVTAPAGAEPVVAGLVEAFAG